MVESYWLSITEVSKHINIPTETVRRYIRQHRKWLKLKKDGKRYLVHKESLMIIEKIRELYSSNYNLYSVEEELSILGLSMTVTINDCDERMNDSNLTDELKQIKDVLNKQQDFNQALIEKLNKQSNYINQLENHSQKRNEEQYMLTRSKENKRDERMMKMLQQHQDRIEQRLLERDQHLVRVIRELQEQSAVTKENKIKGNFWRRLFEK